MLIRFKPRRSCAACGSSGLRTVGTRDHPPEAGWCQKCGVYVGLECASVIDEDVRGRPRRPCPGCGGQLRADHRWWTMILLGILLAADFGVGGSAFYALSEGERELEALPIISPGELRPGDDYVKVQGEIVANRTPVIWGRYEKSSDGDDWWRWYPEDFELRKGGASIPVNSSGIRGYGEWAIEVPARANRSYLPGDVVIVAGDLEWRNGSPLLHARQIALSQATFVGFIDKVAYAMWAIAPIALVLGVLGLWTRKRRLDSHARNSTGFPSKVAKAAGSAPVR